MKGKNKKWKQQIETER